MIIKHTNLADGSNHLSFNTNCRQIGLDFPFFDDIIVNCYIDKFPNQIIVKCYIELNVHLNCDRCNEEYETKVTNDFILTYLFDRNRVQEDELNIYYLSPTEDKIDISKDVYEYSIISLPLKNLCKDDCKGLCPKCGKNLNKEKCTCEI
ncbi:MAG: DUF177 domain-containing protein [Ignavibacteriales bacterium]|nr:DUF177 domain-containing protein [Ignavibacteriales bacterium]